MTWWNIREGHEAMSVNDKRRQARHPAPATGYARVSSAELKRGRVQWSIPLSHQEMTMSSGDAGRHRYRVWLVWSKQTKHYVVNYPYVVPDPIVAGSPMTANVRRNQFQSRDLATARQFFEDRMLEAAKRMALDVLLGTTGGGA